MTVPYRLTLTGPGGTGKTHLALEAAVRLADSLSGAVWFVPLADLLDPALIPGAITDALQLSRSGEVEPLEQAVAALRAEALREQVGAPLPPPERPRYDRQVAQVAQAHAALSEDAFSAAWSQGRALRMEQAIDCALEDAAD